MASYTYQSSIKGVVFPGKAGQGLPPNQPFESFKVLFYTDLPNSLPQVSS